MKINLALKLVIGYSLMAVLLIICGIVGYNATNKMTQVNDFLVNEAHDTVQGALQTSNGVREQIKFADDILSGKLSENIQSIQKIAQQKTERAFLTMINAKQIPEQQVERLNQAQQAFTAALNPLMQSYQQYQTSYQKMIDNADQFKTLLSSFNELANRIIVERETNWDTNQAANSQQTEEWFAASGSTEAKLALFAQLYYYQRLLNNTSSAQIQELIKNSQTDLDIYIDDLSAMQLAEQLIKDSDQSYAQSFSATYDEHKKLYAEAQKNHLELQAHNKTYINLANKLMQQTDAIEQTSTEIINKEIDAIHQIKSSAFISIITTVIIGILLVIIAYTLTLKTVVSPVRKVADKFNDISKGEGDLTQQIIVSGGDEISELSNGFNEFIQQIRQLIIQLIQVVEQLGNTSSNLASQSMHTQQQMQTQQAATDSVTHNMDDMALHVDEVFKAAQQADNSMQSMNTTLHESQQVISSTLDSIHEFGSEIESTATVIEQLNHDSQEVDSVLDVIHSIAEQTNLLALNAAIEAARAGEQGRGFAVVADEVRTLASRTQQSTTEIQAIIERLQQGTEKATTAMVNSRAKAHQTMSNTDSASESLASITGDIQSMGEIISQITSAASAQNEKTGIMHQSLVNIRDINTETTSSNAHMNDITLELNKLASQLQDLVGQFKV
jgi:methyl-accepting chemotaxis protein